MQNLLPMHPAKVKMIEHANNKNNIFFMINSFRLVELISFCYKYHNQQRLKEH